MTCRISVSNHSRKQQSLLGLRPANNSRPCSFIRPSSHFRHGERMKLFIRVSLEQVWDLRIGTRLGGTTATHHRTVIEGMIGGLV